MGKPHSPSGPNQLVVPGLDYHRDPLTVARELIGSAIRNPNGQSLGTVTRTQAFDHLLGATLARYGQIPRRPGGIFIMPYRAGRLINVVTNPNTKTEAPQVVWLMEVRNQVGEILKTGRFFKDSIEQDLDSLNGMEVNNNPLFKIIPSAGIDPAQIRFTSQNVGKLPVNSLGIYEI